MDGPDDGFDHTGGLTHPVAGGDDATSPSVLFFIPHMEDKRPW